MEVDDLPAPVRRIVNNCLDGERSCLVKRQSNTLRRVSVRSKIGCPNDFAVTISNLINVTTTNGMKAYETTRNATN